jgi:regulator of protease activity HflC (stomatin/prohibitin superfamily)
MNSIKRLGGIFIAIIAAMFLTACGQTVQAGYAGVKIEKYGDNRGVAPEVLGPGRYWLGFNTDLVEYPTFTQTVKWTKSANEGKAVDESISFQVGGGITCNTDLAISFHIDKENIPKAYQRYHLGMEEIADGPLRNMVRDELNSAGLKYNVEDLQGPAKAKLIDEVSQTVKTRASEIGVTVESLSWINEPRWPDNVTAAINAKISATQDAMRVENEVRKTKAEQEKVVVAADAQVKVAEAEAKAIALRGEAYRNNPQVLQLEIAKMNADALRETKIQYFGGQAPMLFKNVDGK